MFYTYLYHKFCINTHIHHILHIHIPHDVYVFINPYYVYISIMYIMNRMYGCICIMYIYTYIYNVRERLGTEMSNTSSLPCRWQPSFSPLGDWS